MNNELPLLIISEENQSTYTESVQYHLVGPDTFKQSSSRISSGDDRRESRNRATAGRGMVGMDAEYRTYENHDTNVNMLLLILQLTYVYCIIYTIS
jgi:hypothetical protein